MKRRTASYTSIPYAIFLVLLICSQSSFNNVIIQSKGALLDPTPEFIMDQSQIRHSHDSSVHSSVQIAQSFKPSMSPLTRIELKIEKLTEINYPLQVSIRKELTSPDLASVQVSSDDIPYYTNWIECNIPDIELEINKTYYIVARTYSPSGQSYSWYDIYSDEGDYYSRGEQWFSNDAGDTWEKTSTFGFDIDCTFRTYSYISNTDLICKGFLNWSEVTPGEEISGSFTVQNNGTPYSHLDWKIYNWPSWGIWTFSQSAGTDLRPEDGEQTIYVTVEAPHTDIPDIYNGKILIINQDNPEDYETIYARMVTPKIKSKPLFNFNTIIYKLIPEFYPYFSYQAIDRIFFDIS